MLEKLQSITARFGPKASSYLTQTVYYGKVTSELAKQVYWREGLQIPSLRDFSFVYRNLWADAMHAYKNPNLIKKQITSLNVKQGLKYGAYGIQILGFYSVGEIIGRRKLVGYKTY